MKKRTICSGIIAAAGVLFLLAVMLDVLTIDLADAAGAFADQLENALDKIPGVENGSISCSSYGMIKNIWKIKESSGSEELDRVRVYFQITMVLPYILTACAVFLGFARRRWSYGLCALSALVSGGFLAANCFVVFPKVLTEMIEANLNGGLVQLIYDGMTGGNMEQLLRKIIFQGMEIGYWVSLALLAVLFAASLAGLCMGKEKASRADTEKIGAGEKDRDDLRKSGQTGIYCMTGEYAGTCVPLKEGETIVVGRDAGLSHLIILGQAVSRRHCGICYDPAVGEYLVEDYSLNGTFADGVRLTPNQASGVPRGTVLSLGDTDSQLRLL